MISLRESLLGKEESTTVERGHSLANSPYDDLNKPFPGSLLGKESDDG